MCLILHRFSRRRIASKDITCYKVIRRRGGSFYGWYQLAHEHVFGELQETTLDYPDYHKHMKGKGILQHMFGVFYINRGFHSFTSIKELKKYVDNMWASNPIFVECVIPKGSEYYIGKWDDETYTNYASSKLIVVKQVYL